MKTTERFTNAVTKLYNAFHNGELELTDCKKCAVGNICDNRFDWFDTVSMAKSRDLFRFVKVKHIEIPKEVNSYGYTGVELANIESIFSRAHYRNYPNGRIHNIKNAQFNALCAVIEYLCELDGIPNVMDYTCLFETENEKPKYELIF